MNTKLGRRLSVGALALLPLLTGCNTAWQWRDPPQQARTKLVCSVRGVDRHCIQLTDAEFRDFARRMQPDV